MSMTYQIYEVVLGCTSL